MNPSEVEACRDGRELQEQCGGRIERGLTDVALADEVINSLGRTLERGTETEVLICKLRHLCHVERRSGESTEIAVVALALAAKTEALTAWALGSESLMHDRIKMAEEAGILPRRR
jgi:hypothetical protein